MSELRELPELPPFEHDDETTVAPAPPTIFDSLKAERARVQAEASFDLVVPGWGECLVLHLGSITSQQQQRIFERLQKGGTIGQMHADNLVAAFRELRARETPTSELQQLVDEEGEPYGLDERLAERLQLGPVTNARGVLLALFSGANSRDTAISAAGSEWLDWARSTSSEVDESFVGE